MNRFVELILLGLLIFITNLKAEPIVETPLGKIEGFNFQNSDGSISNIFLGIRYAKAPIEDLRFERPVPVNPWDTTYEAKKFPLGCISFHESVRAPNGESEDCLFLNIITPSNKSSDHTSYPILIWIHGGGFGFGSTAKYGYEHLSQNFAKHDIIIVTIQYRLGAFGFYSTKDNILPGNMGLWDQIEAMKFLHKILPSLGGDISRVTIWGQSAGAASVTALVLSPHSNHLFNQTIQISGTILSEWALNDGVIDNSKALAKELGCNKDDVPCMKNKSTNEIMLAVEKMGPVKKSMRRYMFHPRQDDQFFSSTIETRMQTNKVTSLIGVTDLEMGMIVHKPYHPVLNILAIPQERKKDYNAKDLELFISQIVVPHWESGREGGRFRNALFDYFVDRNPSNDSNVYARRTAELISDLMITVPVLQEVNLRTVNDRTTYLFLQTHAPKNCCEDFPNAKGAMHSNELGPLFELSNWQDYVLDEDDIKFKNVMLEGFRNFVKTGNPSNENQEWPAVTKEHPTRYLEVKPDPEIHEDFLADRMKFWTDVLPSKIGTKILRKTRLPFASEPLNTSSDRPAKLHAEL